MRPSKREIVKGETIGKRRRNERSNLEWNEKRREPMIQMKRNWRDQGNWMSNHLITNDNNNLRDETRKQWKKRKANAKRTSLFLHKRCEFEIEPIISVDESLLFLLWRWQKKTDWIVDVLFWRAQRNEENKIGEKKNGKMKVVEKWRCALLWVLQREEREILRRRREKREKRWRGERGR